MRSMVAYRTQFWVELLSAGVRLATGLLSLTVIFVNVDTVNGWSEASAGIVLGVFFIVTGLHEIAFGPSISALSGYDGDIVSGVLDFHLLRPRSTQLLVSVSRWAPTATVEVIVGAIVIARAFASAGSALPAWHIATFIYSVTMSVSILYSLTMSLASLMFWKADFLFTWLLRPVVQLARFPVALYPGWLKLPADVGRAGGGAYDSARAGLDGRGVAPDAVGCDRARGRGPGWHEPVVPSRTPALRKRIELSGARNRGGGVRRCPLRRVVTRIPRTRRAAHLAAFNPLCARRTEGEWTYR